jgi:hypothetical protein
MKKRRLYFALPLPFLIFYLIVGVFLFVVLTAIGDFGN